MQANIVVLPGDGIGPEVVAAANAVLEAVADRFSHQFEREQHLIGGAAIDACGDPLPAASLDACRSADGVLLGAVGGPKWDDPTATVRPEQGLLKIRKALGLYANLRPVKLHAALIDASPLKADRLAGVDLLVIRELTGGIYFGESKRWSQEGETYALNTMVYNTSEIRRVALLAFQAASQRQGKLTSIDKANVLEVSRLWRQTVAEMAEEFADVTLDHVLVDAATMHLLSRPASFDVIVAPNMFGDILTDEASMLSGSIGVLPSASLGEQRNRHGLPLGLYEPIHGSAPDIAGQGKANPIGMILSTAMLLRHSLGLEQEAQAVERAVDTTLDAGKRTADIAEGPDTPILTTGQMTHEIVARIGAA